MKNSYMRRKQKQLDNVKTAWNLRLDWCWSWQALLDLLSTYPYFRRNHVTSDPFHTIRPSGVKSYNATWYQLHWMKMHYLSSFAPEDERVT